MERSFGCFGFSSQDPPGAWSGALGASDGWGLVYIMQQYISIPDQIEEKPCIPHVPTDCPRKPPKTIGKRDDSACRLQMTILLFLTKSYCFSETL